MMNTSSLLRPGIEVLVLNSIYAAVLFAIVLPLCVALRRQSPAVRHALWSLVLIRLVLPPSLAMPWSVGALLHGEAFTFEGLSLTTIVTAGGTDGGGLEFIAVTGVLWMAGFALVSAVMFRRRLQLRGIVRTAEPLTDPALLQVFRGIRDRLGIRRDVRFVRGASDGDVFTLGTIRPVVFLPERLMKQLAREAVECVVAHELAHVRRLDDLKMIAQAWVQSVFFFHPVAWIAGSMRVEETELISDRLAIERAKIAPADYGRGLLDVIRLGLKPVTMTPAFFKRRKPVNIRFESLSRSRPAGPLAILLVVALAVILLPMAAGKLSASGDPDQAVRVDGDVVPPKLITQVDPTYPEAARKEHAEGTVVLDATIQKDGTVSHVEVLKSAREDFSTAAVDAMRQWTFQPATLHDKPITVKFTVTIRFTLDSEKDH